MIILDNNEDVEQFRKERPDSFLNAEVGVHIFDNRSRRWVKIPDSCLEPIANHITEKMWL